jgi:hypothetical protein
MFNIILFLMSCTPSSNNNSAINSRSVENNLEPQTSSSHIINQIWEKLKEIKSKEGDIIISDYDISKKFQNTHPIYTAFEHGDLNLAKILYKSYENNNYDYILRKGIKSFAFKKHLISIAAFNNKKDIVEYFIDKKDFCNYDENKLVLMAAIGNSEQVKELLNKNVAINSGLFFIHCNEIITPLNMALKNNHFKTAKILLANDNIKPDNSTLKYAIPEHEENYENDNLKIQRINITKDLLSRHTFNNFHDLFNNIVINGIKELFPEVLEKMVKQNKNLNNFYNFLNNHHLSGTEVNKYTDILIESLTNSDLYETIFDNLLENIKTDPNDRNEKINTIITYLSNSSHNKNDYYINEFNQHKIINNAYEQNINTNNINNGPKDIEQALRTKDVSILQNFLQENTNISLNKFEIIRYFSINHTNKDIQINNDTSIDFINYLLEIDDVDKNILLFNSVLYSNLEVVTTIWNSITYNDNHINDLANIKNTNSDDGLPLIFYAIINGDSDIFDFLIQKGALLFQEEEIVVRNVISDFNNEIPDEIERTETINKVRDRQDNNALLYAVFARNLHAFEYIINNFNIHNFVEIIKDKNNNDIIVSKSARINYALSYDDAIEFPENSTAKRLIESTTRLMKTLTHYLLHIYNSNDDKQKDAEVRITALLTINLVNQNE